MKGELAPPRLGHLTAAQYTQLHYLPADLFEAYLTFAVVRDPFSRVESMYRYMAADFLMSFESFATDYLPSVIRNDTHPWKWFVRPQWDVISVAIGSQWTASSSSRRSTPRFHLCSKRLD